MIKFILSTILLTLPLLAYAHDCQVDGIYYNLNSKGKTAEVTNRNSNSNSYSGSVTIPEKFTYEGVEYSVTSIGNDAFFLCAGLTSMAIPNSIISIGEWAFTHCIGLTSVTIPNSVTSIGQNAFSECSGLTTVYIPNSVTSIGSNTFRNCSSLTSVTIPNSVRRIGDYAFSGCHGLTSVTIPNSVRRIGTSPFSSCESLTSIKVEEGNKYYDSRSDCNAIIETKSNTLIAGCMNTIIPNSVTSIGQSAFSGCSGLTSVTIPNSVTSIGQSAFYNCTSLTSVTIPNSVTSIGEWVFSYCSGLTSIKVEDGNKYYDSRSDCNAIIETESNTLIAGCMNTIIPNSVVSIGNGAFSGCSGLTSVTIPNSVTSIGQSAFEGCSGLTSVTIPNSVTYIGVNAFDWCKGLTSVTIPDSVTIIDDWAFAVCTSLTSVLIPKTVTFIGYSSFYGCSKLEEVYCYATMVPATDTYAFQSDRDWGGEIIETNVQNVTLYVTAESLDAYKTTVPWSQFGTILPIKDSNYTLIYIVDGETYTSYTLKEGDTITPEAVPTKEGYTFSGWSETPSTMPASDVTITGTFKANKYTITYMVDGSKLMTEEVAYGSTITPPSSQKDGYVIQWNSHPTTMPAYDITIYGTYTTGINCIAKEESERQVFTPDGKRVETPQKGLNIIRMSDGKMKKVVFK